jgi:FMN phosphatase YigB (HAD superfamily)
MLVHRLPKKPKALIFDIDNTLYANDAYGQAQTEVQIERLAEFSGQSVAETKAALERVRAEYALDHGGAKTSLANAFALLGIPIETSIAWRIELLKPEEFLSKDDELERTLQALSRRFRLIALTNNPVEVGRRTLECLGVSRCFPEIVGLDSCGLSKPSPEPFTETVRRLGLHASACVSVGDRFDVDLKVPLEMGMGAIQVDGVPDVYALPKILLPKDRRRLGVLGGFMSLPLGFAVFAAAAAIVQSKTEAYSIPLVDKAEGRLNAKTVARCYLEGYPGLVTEMKQDEKSGEWLLKVRDSWYAFAKGRWMPQGREEEWSAYRPYIDSIYPWKLIDPGLLPTAVLDNLRKQPERQKTAPPTEGSFAFSLYGGDDRKTVYARQVRIDFLGRGVTAHEICAAALQKVSAEILAAAKGSQEVKAFLDTMESAGAYNWRDIRGQKEMSRHSFGIAIDILPKGWQKKSVYWQWDMEKGLDWAVLPHAKRWSPPEEVVKIFEANGFIWGGKWLVYDTMHFEYHPELLRLRERVLPRFLSVLE